MKCNTWEREWVGETGRGSGGERETEYKYTRDGKTERVREIKIKACVG